MIGDCVVDASVAVKLFVVEEHSDLADMLFDQLTADPPVHFYAPDLLYAECANVLWKYVRYFGYPLENARQDVSNLSSLAVTTVSTADLLDLAFELAVQNDVTVYDASYVALARQLRLPLVTADGALARKSRGFGADVRRLSSLA